jgi:23S rRNA pseudouridine1911/1915/1917 synthase
MAIQSDFKFIVGPEEARMRLDAYLSLHLPECSRSFTAHLIRQEAVHVDGCAQKPGYRVRPEQIVSGHLPPPAPVDIVPEPIPLDIIFEDDDLIIINKPAGLVVHPAAGHPSGTVVNGLLHHCPSLEGIGGEQRPGIVHRLDKDTSGLLTVAKSQLAHTRLSEQFKQRHIEKIYWVLVEGRPKNPRGRIELPIGRHPTDRKKMSTRSPSGRDALTLWCVKEAFPDVTLLEVDLKTGRTHQVRVHCQAMGHPVVGDPVYGWRSRRKSSTKENLELFNILRTAPRQMLHARQLTFIHPVTGTSLTFEAPLPEDIQLLLDRLRTIS